MRRNLIKIWSVIFILCGLTQVSFSQNNKPFSLNESPLPAPTSPVMDYAGVLDPAAKQRIENQIIEFEKISNPRVEIGVAIVDTTGERPIFDYSLAVARGWGIGSRNDDNPSALLLIAVKDRKYFTQVSLDLEDELPDGVAGSLQRRYLVPQFKRGNYSKGVEDTIDAYIRTIKAKQNGESVAPQDDDSDGVDAVDYGTSNCGFICLIILFIIIFIIMSNSGGGGGGGRRRRSGSSWIFVPTGSSGGSSWGGGGSSGGGWGGFGGGGSFGGGGAGGSW